MKQLLEFAFIFINLNVIYLVVGTKSESYCKDFEIEIQNGQRHPAFINDQIFGVEGKIRLECNSGYAVNGTNIFVCIMISNNTFEWYPNPKNIPSCVKKPVCEDFEMPIEDVERFPPYRQGVVYKHGDTIDYFCDSSKGLAFPTIDAVKSKKCVFTNWEPKEEARCVRVCDSGDLQIEHGYRLPRYVEGVKISQVEFHCDQGYRLVGAKIMNCDETNNWTPVYPPTCEITPYCDAPSKLFYAPYQPLKSEYAVDDIIYYKCLSGGKQFQSKCLSHNTWSDPSIECHSGAKIACSRPQNLKNGAVFCRNQDPTSAECCKYNQVVQFTCAAGYVLVGRSAWRCGTNGNYVDLVTDRVVNQTAVQCRPIEVTTNYPVDGGRVKSHVTSSSMVRVMSWVAGGVFSSLLLIIALAFCKPKLRNIKRRWRDFREDESRLIVNGQEVHLPSYDEANTWQPDMWVEPQLPPLLNSLSSALPPPTIDRSPRVADQPMSINQFLCEPIGIEDGQLETEEKNSAERNSEEPCCSRSLLKFDVEVLPVSSSTPLIKSLPANQTTEEAADCSLIGSNEDERESLLRDDSKVTASTSIGFGDSFVASKKEDDDSFSEEAQKSNTDFFRIISSDVQIQKNTFQREKSKTARSKTKWTKF